MEGRGIVDPYTDAKSRGENSFDQRVVDKFHQNDDVDARKDSHHHTIGPGGTQVAAGNHNHDGVNGPQLMAGVTITGAKGGNVALTNLIAALSAAFGFTDNTT